MKEYFLETERLYLRRITSADFKDIAAMLKDPEVMYAWEHTFEDSDVSDWILKNDESYKQCGLGFFLAVNKGLQEVVGQAALKPAVIHSKTYYEIGYIFKKKDWGKGYAAESALALCAYAKTTYPGYEIIFEIRPENQRSIKVAERIGALPSGSFIKNVRGKLIEHLIYKVQ